MAEPATIQALRLYLGERLDGAESDPVTTLTDPELEILLTTCGGIFYKAVADGWSVIAGRLHALIDIDENGSSRKLSGRYKNAKSQSEWYAKVAAAEASVTAASTPRVVGVAASIWQETPEEPLISIFSDNHGYIRTYPLYRFPAILQ